jgi:hypothetical protein
MRLCSIVVLLLGVAAPLADALDVGSVAVIPPGESEPRNQPFIQVDSKKVMLPLRTTYKERVGNVDKDMWAVNYHETSNFDSVDLVAGVEDRIFILPNLWSVVEPDVFAQKLIPHLAFDHLYFEVTKIEGRTLYVRFSGTSARDQKEVEKSFSIVAKIGKGGVSLSVKP